MIKCLIRKANDDYYYSFKTFKLFDDFILFKEKTKCALTIADNFWYQEDVKEIFNAWSEEERAFTMKDAYSISECKYEIFIENDSLEF